MTNKLTPTMLIGAAYVLIYVHGDVPLARVDMVDFVIREPARLVQACKDRGIQCFVLNPGKQYACVHPGKLYVERTWDEIKFRCINVPGAKYKKFSGPLGLVEWVTEAVWGKEPTNAMASTTAMPQGTPVCGVAATVPTVGDDAPPW